MKIVVILAAALLLAIIAIGQPTPQNGEGRAPAANAAGQPNTSAKTLGNIEVLSDTYGVDFGPYLSKVLAAVRRNWYVLIPEKARAPEMAYGKLAIEFAILPDGKVAAMKLVAPSGDVALDRAAWGGIANSVPFEPLPAQYAGPFLSLRFNFYYNPKKGDLNSSAGHTGN